MDPLGKNRDKAPQYLILGIALWAYFTGVLLAYGKPLVPAMISGLVGVGAALVSLILILVALSDTSAGDAGAILAIAGLALIPAYFYFASGRKLDGWDNIAASIVAGAILLLGLLIIEEK